MKVFLFDISRCNGCHNCQIACKDEHCGNAWPPYALEQPDTGHFWMYVDQIEHGSIPKVKVEYRPLMCNHCDDAPCMKAGDDAVYKREDGLVIIDPERSKGRRDLVEACPYGRVFYNEELDIPQKCTGCAHMVDGGEVPHCVDLCATGALRFGDEEDFADELKEARCLVDNGTARVYYKNLPGFFIAGEVWDPQDNEVIIGATLELSSKGEVIKTTQSDAFGDFWFKNLEAGTYTVTINAEGYESITREVELEKSINLGDFPMNRC